MNIDKQIERLHNVHLDHPWFTDDVEVNKRHRSRTLCQFFSLAAGSGSSAGYQISKSLRFNPPDTTYLNWTPGGAGTRNKWTWSGWVKKTKNDSGANYYCLFGAGTASGETSRFYLSWVNDGIGAGYGTLDYRISTRLFRDNSAFYHVLCRYDSTDGTAQNRLRIYVNNEEITSWTTNNAVTLNTLSAVTNAVAHNIGREPVTGAGTYFDGLLADVYLVDGLALDPSSFGETDVTTGQWKPKAYSGSLGTNGFKLNFVGDGTATSAGIGKDAVGSNNFTPNNFSVTAGSGNDSLTDTPTSYGTDAGAGGEVRGNFCVLNTLDKGTSPVISNGGLDFASGSSLHSARGSFGMSTGKWYWEVQPTAFGNAAVVGIANASAPLTSDPFSNANIWGYYGNSAQKINGSASSYGVTFTTNDIIGVAFDADAGTLIFYKNGASQGTAFTGIAAGTYYALAHVNTGSAGTSTFNFGQRPFASTAPSGYKALCTQNLSTPTIVKPSAYFDIETFTGTGATRSKTGLAFQPDFAWFKGRSGATDHAIYDSTRGAQAQIESNTDTIETTEATGLTAFNSDGYTTGALAQLNTNAATYVAWLMKKGATPGLDIVSYTGNGSNRTIAHALGVAPAMVIARGRSAISNWQTWHKSITTGNTLILNGTIAQTASATVWNSTVPTSSVFSLGTNTDVNNNTTPSIAYLFAEVADFSKFGSYTGNASTDGPFVWCGFRPRWIMVKRIDSTQSWFIFDTARDTYNAAQNEVYADQSAAESTGHLFDILSNGFKFRTTYAGLNASGGTYIFMAFAEYPFKYANAR